MTWKFTTASKLAVLLAAAAVVVVGFSVTPASAQTKYDKDGRLNYGPGGPNPFVARCRHRSFAG
jgi:hypothetical protein